MTAAVAVAGRKTLAGTVFAAGAAGVIALPRGRDVALVQADGASDRTILSLPTGSFIADVALSPDGSRVAFGVFTAGSSGPGGSDIAVASVAEAPSGYAIVAPRDRPGMLLAAPYWSPDGMSIAFEGVGLGPDGKPILFTDVVSADGTGRRRLVENGRYPTLSPDGGQVAFVRSRPDGDSLYIRALDGGPERQVLSESQFVAIGEPRYSPDGARSRSRACWTGQPASRNS